MSSQGKTPIQRKVTTNSLQLMKEAGERISALTAYDFVMAQLLDTAGVDMILVGDSVGMVVLGHETTMEVTIEDMVHHVRAVARARPRALIVADMPWMSFHLSPIDTVRNAAQLIRAGAATWPHRPRW